MKMRFNGLKQDKGVAGLTILLSLVTMLFVIGLLVFIFSLMGGEISTATYDKESSVPVTAEAIGTPTTAGVTLAGASARNGACGTVVLYNSTGDLIVSANYTQTGCVIVNTTDEYANYGITYLANYSYTYSANNSATEVISETTEAIATVTNWFDIFIVIGAMVVLILLTVIIITAIRGSGLMGGSGREAGNVGSA